MDVPLSIELLGFPPNQPVTVTAIQYYQTGSRWLAQATFLADNNGHIDTGRQAPISGDYEGVAEMGLIWSAQLVAPPSRALPEDWAMHPSSIQFAATAAQGKSAQVEATRDQAAAGVTRHVIRTNGLVGTLFLPPGKGPHPAVLVLHGGNGAGPGGSGDETQGAMLASRGYAAFNIAYFAAPGLPRGLVNIPLEYFEKAIRWMRSQPWLGDGFLAVWGPSRGGELALLLGATFPDINAVSAWVPSGVVFWPLGLPEPSDTRYRAAWTLGGKPLPFLQEINSMVEPIPPQNPGEIRAFTPIYLRHLGDARALERATIPVENTRGPILLVSGTDDQMWPSSALADVAMRRLKAKAFRYQYRHLKYEGAGHTILLPYGPRTSRNIAMRVEGFEGQLCAQGGTPRLDAEAGADAWQQMLQFFEEARRDRR
jgi:dienelactone hydrolase